ncbi:DUF6214 family protein [Streptomyces antibioticus]|uniref:DUF6214 family protein n=1 Tax=Streptomyces antibioticus TaxID=1890 RepID=UPI0033BC32A9
MLEASFLNLSDRSAEDGTVSVWPAWEVQEGAGATSWFHVRLEFPDGARVELLAVVADGHVSIEDVRAMPALSLIDLTELADWIEGPLFEWCGGGVPAAVEAQVALPAAGGAGGPEGYGGSGLPAEPGGIPDLGAAVEPAVPAEEPAPAGPAEDAVIAVPAERPEPLEPPGPPGPRRARPAWPRGGQGRWLVAQEYRAAQEDGFDPVLAVMCATGHSRRRSLRLIAQARDAGYLAPRHARR